MHKYWSFYWPLALTGIAMVLATQFQNGALARYPEAVRELAIFALASSTFGFFNAGLNFTSQLSNVFARGRASTRRSLRFVVAWCALLTLPLIGIAFLPFGADGIAFVYGVDAVLTERIREYLALMLPLLLITAVRMFFTGLLIQARMTAWVTALNVVFLTATVAALIIGFTAELKPAHTLVGAQIIAGLLHWGLVYTIFKHRYSPPDEELAAPTYPELVRFFLPMTTTGVMFAVSRPVLYAFVARSPGGIATIAALRVGFDLSSVFQQAANQFRHFFVTFGLDDLAVKRRFMALVNLGITTLLFLIAATPLSNYLLGTLLGVTGDVLEFATDVLLVMCLMPTIIIARNYFHGFLMVGRRTSGMAFGGILRVVAMAFAAQAAFALGLLDHITATLILILGFLVETIVVALAAHTRRYTPPRP